MATRRRSALFTSTGMRRSLAAAAVAASLVTLSACSSSAGSQTDGSDASAAAAKKKAAPVSLALNVADGASSVNVDTALRASAADGTLTDVRVHYGDAKTAKTALKGSLSPDKTTWSAGVLLEPGQTYRMSATGANADGETKKRTSSFTTQSLTLEQQTFPSISPLRGETVGVGMPVIVRFDLPVKNKAAIERELEVSSSPKVEGTWSWLNDNEVHYRPENYWPAGTVVKVRAKVNGVDAGNGIYGQENRYTSFKVGKSVISTVNVAAHRITVKINGKVARTLPATTGKDGFDTRRGTKIIMEKHSVKRMDAATTGIDESSSEYYDIPDVRYAMRVTNSGEFIHAAPWSTGSQGAANVSHGCVGLGTSNARWFYNVSSRGDVVKFINSSRGLEDQNGWTDWNESYAKFKQGSALS